jgi:O-succinylbenzoic acid--CoA ligase
VRAGRDNTPRLGILSANRPGYVFAIHAARWLGVPVVPLNWRQTARELAWQLRDAGIDLLLTDQLHQPVAEEAGKGLRVAIQPISALEQIDPTTHRLDREPLLDLATEAAILYTSGTSGRPKGARLTHGNFWHSAVASALHLGHREDDVWLATLPLFHVGGLSILLRSVIGCTPVILHDRFEPERALAAIDDGATLVSLVPTMLRRLLAARGEIPWPESLRCILLGGSASPPDLIAECIRRGIPVAPTYGLTEAASQVTTLRPAEVHRKPLSSGLSLPMTRLRIAGATGEREPPPFGEIEIQGPTVFTGYLGRPPSEQDRSADGWFRTGDVGYLDDEGFLCVVDRRDDLIVSGGENVYPAEVERVLLAHPHVLDAGVTSLPDGDWGTRPIAGVIWQGNEVDVEKSLREHCAAHLARYKVPERILAFPELPRSASGKLLRRRLREMIRERMEPAR